MKTGTEAPKTSLNETYNRTQATFAGSRQSFYRVDYANDETMQKAFNNGFSFEVLYKPTNTNNVCPMSAQESGGCGIEQASGGLIQFYCHIGGSYKVLKSNVKAKANHYYHVVAVYDKDKAQTRIYIDGEPAGEMAAEGNYGFPPKRKPGGLPSAVMPTRAKTPNTTSLAMWSLPACTEKRSIETKPSCSSRM